MDNMLKFLIDILLDAGVGSIFCGWYFLKMTIEFGVTINTVAHLNYTKGLLLFGMKMLQTGVSKFKSANTHQESNLHSNLRCVSGI